MIRQLKKTLLLCAALTLGFSAPASANKTDIRVYVIPITDVAPFHAAKEQGYFAAEGLTVSDQSGAGGAVGIPGLIGGAYDFAFSNIVSIVQAKSQGLDLKIVAPGSDATKAAPDIAGIFARAGDGVQSGADLNGKTVAVNTRNNIIWLYARQWIADTGGNPDSVTFRDVPFPQMADAVRRKQVDAAFTVEPFVTMALEDDGLVEVAYPYSEVQPGLNVAQYVATSDFIKKNPETVAKFARALKKGAEWVNEHAGTEAYAKMVSSYTRMEPTLIDKLVSSEAPVSVSPDSIRQTIQVMQGHGLLDTDIDVADLLVTEDQGE